MKHLVLERTVGDLQRLTRNGTQQTVAGLLHLFQDASEALGQTVAALTLELGSLSEEVRRVRSEVKSMSGVTDAAHNQHASGLGLVAMALGVMYLTQARSLDGLSWLRGLVILLAVLNGVVGVLLHATALWSKHQSGSAAGTTAADPLLPTPQLRMLD